MTEKSLDETSKPIEILDPNSVIILRQFSLPDVDPIFNLIDGDRYHLSQFGDETADKYKTREDVKESIVNPKNPDRLRFGIWNKDGEFVGSINLTPDKDNKARGEIGYYLGSGFTGKGYMLMAVLALTKHAFSNFGYTELYGKVRKGNTSSSKVLLKAGFKETGSEKEDTIFTLNKPL